MPDFALRASYVPTGDQPGAIAGLVQGLRDGLAKQTLLGVTGSGKTFTMANVIAELQRPTLILAHNKTLAAQLYGEFKEFFPDNAVEYFVSYYDYYQPEAYIARTDTYIEKDTSINDEIERLRNAATASVLTRRDVVIVASVSCIYGLGSPEEYNKLHLSLTVGQEYTHEQLQRRLVDMQYDRNDLEVRRGFFRKRGDVLEIAPAYGDYTIRLDFFGDELERIAEVDSLTGTVLAQRNSVRIFPAKHFVTSPERLNAAIERIRSEMEERVALLKSQENLVEAQRLEQRTLYDIEMLETTGMCKGIENYSRHIDGREAGEPPYTLLNYLPDDFLLFVDESHMTLPQVRGMYAGDRARKENLIQYGFRLPSALDNRPLRYEEFERAVGQVIYVSATPSLYERTESAQVVEQLIRPTGLLDPVVEVRATDGQIADLLQEIRSRTANGQRVLVTTITKKMAEDLTEYLLESGVKVNYLHFEVDTLERVETLRDLRLGVYDVVVGINLLREGLDLPEVSLVAILDADKEGFLRSETSLIQIIGRAARHLDGRVIMYADKRTAAMRVAMEETERRRSVQAAYNAEHGITPQAIKKAIAASMRGAEEELQSGSKASSPSIVLHEGDPLSKKELSRIIKEKEQAMQKAAKQLDFEKAAALRDELKEYRALLLEVEV